MAAAGGGDLSPSAVKSIRFYEAQYPEINHVVVGIVTSVSDTVVKVNLVEYGNIEGIIPCQELSRRRVRSVRNHAKIGQRIVIAVLRISHSGDNVYIDLSKKQVTDAEKASAWDRCCKAKLVFSMLRAVAHTTKADVIGLLSSVAWPLARAYGTAHEGIKMAYTDPSVLDELTIAPEVREVLIATIKEKMRPQMRHLQSHINVTCFNRHGIDAVKDALLAGLALTTEEPQLPLSISVQAAPTYLLQTQSTEPDVGMKKLWQVIEAVKAKMATYGGEVEVTTAPALIDETAAEGEEQLAPDEEDD